RYDIGAGKPSGNIGVIMAGNIPLVGFHDLLCVLAAGHRAVVKLSGRDAHLLPMLVKLLRQIDHRLAPRVTFADDLDGVDAVVATGSNNSARYFELRYGRLPHIFRRSRTSVAALSGSESDEQLRLLAHDALSYFGLGCRSVGKIFIPESYNALRLRDAFAQHACLRAHEPYDGCCRHAQALLQMHGREFFDFGGCIATFSNELHSPVGTLFLQRYRSDKELQSWLLHHNDELQCVVAGAPVAGVEPRCVAFGQAQHPRLTDYADGVDTMQFLLSLPCG
ncbi:MAG: hypothetical protein LBH84_09450, partial [Prevotellaceae bacterium]|nr:hypothetical protein [Prevotellaceae bacterium]